MNELKTRRTEQEIGIREARVLSLKSSAEGPLRFQLLRARLLLRWLGWKEFEAAGSYSFVALGPGAFIRG